MSNQNENKSGDHGHGGHHVTPLKVYYAVFAALIVGTIVTVATSYIDFGGSNNILIAMLIATVKALLVILFFMGLKYEGIENNATFFCTFIFLALFIGLTSADIFFRHDLEPVKVDTSEMVSSGPALDIAKLMQQTAEMKTKAQAIFTQQCLTCHGADGQGNGPAAAAFNPKPRNFTVGDGWKNGRKVSEIVKTLSNGLGSMPNFSGLPAEDRIALAHYIRALSPNAPQDSADDVAALQKAVGGGGPAKPRIPVDFALDRMANEWEAAHPAKITVLEEAQRELTLLAALFLFFLPRLDSKTCITCFDCVYYSRNIFLKQVLTHGCIEPF